MKKLSQGRLTTMRRKLFNRQFRITEVNIVQKNKEKGDHVVTVYV